MKSLHRVRVHFLVVLALSLLWFMLLGTRSRPADANTYDHFYPDLKGDTLGRPHTFINLTCGRNRTNEMTQRKWYQNCRFEIPPHGP